MDKKIKQEPKKLLAPQEKFAKLVKKNKLLLTLKKEFNLEVTI